MATVTCVPGVEVMVGGMAGGGPTGSTTTLSNSLPRFPQLYSAIVPDARSLSIADNTSTPSIRTSRVAPLTATSRS